MADESSFLIQILLDARDNATAKVAALRAEVAALKREAESSRGGSTAPVARDLDDTGRAARDAERDVRGAREEHERLRDSNRGPEVRRGREDIDDLGASSRKASQDLDKATESTYNHGSAASRMGKTLGDSGTELDKQSERLKKSSERAEEAAHSYEMFDAAVRHGNVSTDDARRGYSQFAQELGGIAKGFKAGSEEALNFSRIASEARSRSGDFGPSEAEIRRVEAAYKDFDDRVKSGVTTTAQARRGYKDLSSELGSIGRSFRAGTDDAQRFLRMAEQAGERAKKAAYLSPGEWNWDTVLAKTAARFDSFGVKIVSLSANLRGIGLSLIVGLAQQLDTAVVGLAGGLFSVASAAVEAGAALGGALVAGISQAIPVLAVVGATVERLKNVFQAVGLHTQAQQSQEASPNKEASTRLQNSSAIANAEHSLANAYESVTVAQEHVRQSQEALTLSRIEAIRNIVNLTLAEKDAKLQAEGASISLTEAHRALEQAVQSGNTAGIEGAQLQVREAELAKQKADIEVPRSEEDAKRAQRQKVEENPSVISAREALKAARADVDNEKFAVEQARTQLKLAQMQQSEPMAGASSQSQQLKSITKNFSAPENALYQSLVRIEEMVRSPNGPLAKVSEYLVEPFAKGVHRIADLLESSEAIQPLDNLAKAMGKGAQEIVNTLTGVKAEHFFGEMAEDASKNIPIIADAFSKLLEFFQTVAKAASPILHETLETFDNFITHISQKDSSPEGLTKLQSFFEKAGQYAREILSMSDSFVRLMRALGRDSAPSGGSLIESLTASMNKATDWVNTHGPQVKKFFEETADVMRQIGFLLDGLGLGMLRAFNPSSTAALQQFLTQILIPALTKLLDILGWITTAVLNTIPGGTYTLQVLAGIVATILGIGKVYGPALKVFTVMKALVEATKAFAAASDMSRITAAWEAFTGVLKRAKEATKGVADEQIALDEAEAGGGAAVAGGGAVQGGVDVAEGAGGAAVVGGLGTAILPATIAVGGVAIGDRLTSRLGQSTGNYGLPTTGSFGDEAGRDFHQQLSNIDVTKNPLTAGLNIAGDLGGVNNLSEKLFGGPGSSEERLRKFGDQITKVKGKLEDLPHGKMEQINKEAIDLAKDPSLKQYRGSLEEVIEQTNPLIIATHKWTEKTKEYLNSLGPVAKEVANSFQSMSDSSGNVVEGLQNHLQQSLETIKNDLGKNSVEGKNAAIAAFGEFANGVEKGVNKGVITTSIGMQQIGKVVADALKEYGINPSQINKYIANTAPTKFGRLSELMVGESVPKYAAGGWQSAQPGGIFQTAEAGHDEVILTTDPSHAARQGKLLNEYAQRAPQALEYAQGGFVADPGTNFSVGKEPEIVGALRQLAEFAHVTIYGISGYRSPSHSVAVGGFSNDPHTRGEAADIGWGSNSRQSMTGVSEALLKKFDLYRPFWPASAAEVNHVQLLPGGKLPTAGKVKGGSSAITQDGYEIEVPKVAGLTGQMKKVAQGALNKVTKAANQYLQNVIGSLPSPEGFSEGNTSGAMSVGGSGGTSSKNEHLGREMMIKFGFPASEWNDLQKLWTQESGWSDTAENNPSMGWLASGNASGIPQSDGNGPVYKKGDAKEQILWGLKYIKRRYGTIAKAWASEVANHSYAAGGQIKRMFMAAGGTIAPWGGRPVEITAHEGERVMNPMQYDEAARLAGTNAAGLDRHMGFDGGQPRQHFEVGGHIKNWWGTHQRTQQPITRASVTTSVPDLNRLSTSAITNNSGISNLFKTVSNGFNVLNRLDKKSATATGAFAQYVKALTEAETGVLAKVQEGFAAMTSRLNAAAAKASFKKLAGSKTLFSSASPLQQTDQSLKNLTTERKSLEEETKFIENAEKQIQKRIAALKKKKQTKGVKEELKQLVTANNAFAKALISTEEQIQQNIEAAAQATQERIQDKLNAVSDEYGTSAANLQSQQGAKQALGRYSELPSIDAQISKNAQEHINALQGVLQEAEASGNQEMVSTIKQEMDSLRQTVTEAAAQFIADEEQAIQQQAGIQTSTAGLDQVRAQISAAQGNYGAQGAYALSGYQTEVSSIHTQLSGDKALLKQAEAEGNEGQIATLTEAINNLEGALLTNEQAIKDNTSIVTQAYVSQVTRQGQFSTGIYGGLISLIQTAGQITGATNVGAEAKLYEQSNKSLGNTNKELISGSSSGGPQGLESFLKENNIQGVPNLSGLSGEALMNAIAGMNIPQIESQMDPAQQQVFEQIISSLVQNTEQIEVNNKELAGLNGQLTQLQTFSTSMFGKLRDSVFTGVGGLLPTYAESLGVPANPNNPGLTGAGYLETPKAEPKQIVTPQQLTAQALAEAANKKSPTVENMINNFTHPVEVVDPHNFGKKVAFSMKTPSP
jgi:hypothetical protein